MEPHSEPRPCGHQVESYADMRAALESAPGVGPLPAPPARSSQFLTRTLAAGLMIYSAATLFTTGEPAWMVYTFGPLNVVLAIVFIAWLCVQALRRHRYRRFSVPAYGRALSLAAVDHAHECRRRLREVDMQASLLLPFVYDRASVDGAVSKVGRAAADLIDKCERRESHIDSIPLFKTLFPLHSAAFFATQVPEAASVLAHFQDAVEHLGDQQDR